jgi:hypothetical protein
MNGSVHGNQYNPQDHVPKYVGNIWFVDKTNGSDSNDGKSPKSAFATLAYAESQAQDYDRVRVKGEAYAENLVISGTAKEFVFEHGAIVNPSSGVPITVSGNRCIVRVDHGAMKLMPPSGETGMVISGDFVYAEEVRADCNDLGDIGFDISGNGSDLRRCRCADPASGGKAFSISGSSAKLEDCCTGGTLANNSYGFYIESGADKPRIKNCGSQGHAGAGFYAEAGVTNGAIESCYSGGGDGRWVDIDGACAWPHFAYDNEKRVSNTLDNTGAGTSNLFKITGAVNIYGLRAHVEEVLAADVGNLKYELYDGSATDITDTVASASAPVDSLFVKEKKSADPLILYSSANAEIMEEVDLKKAVFGINAKAGVDTFIRINWSGNAASGKLDHHIVWEPLTEEGFVSVV